MGAENSILDDFNLDDPIPDAHPLWTFCNGTLEEDKLVSVLSDQSGDKQKRVLFHKSMKFLKSVRHPFILRFLSSHDSSIETHMVTERVSPLSLILYDLDSTEICSGLYGAIEGLSFLHDKIGVSHNNVCTDSVYVSPTGCWKIGGLEHVCKYLDVTPSFLESSRKFRDKNSISPEEKDGKLVITPELGHTRDVYSFGVWAESLLEHMGDLGDMTKTFELRIQDECLNSNPKQRPKLNTFLEDRLFKCDLLSITLFLSNITLKSEQERKEFFSDLVPKLLTLPQDVVGKCLTQLLLCRFVLLDQHAASYVVPHLLTPCRDSTENCSLPKENINPIFSVPKFQQYVIPELYKVFHCHDYHIRVVLLTHFAKYVDLFDKKDLEEVIFPEILLGIRDSSEDLAALSLHGLADMVTVLGRDTVIGGKSKVYFTKGTPKHPLATDKNDVSNVNGIMGKVLLKDLVNSSKGNEKISRVKHEEEIEQKRKERQEKLKEAKLKREQKRLEKLSQQKNKENQLKMEENEVSNTGVEQNETFPGKDVVLPDRINEEDTTIQHIETRLPVEPVSVPTTPAKVFNSFDKDVRKKKYDEEIKIEPDIYVTHDDEDTSEEDWSDWENSIREEDSVVRDTSDNQSVVPNNYIMEHSKVKSFDEQQGHSTIGKEMQAFHWSDNSTTSKEAYSNQNTLKSKTTKSPMKLQSTQKKKVSKTNNTPLGSEFDIKNVEIKVNEDALKELDFFADMTPDFKPSAMTVQSGIPEPSIKGSSSLSLGSTGLESNSKEISQNLMFSSVDAGDTDTAGWGDDLNWDDDAF